MSKDSPELGDEYSSERVAFQNKPDKKTGAPHYGERLHSYGSWKPSLAPVSAIAGERDESVYARVPNLFIMACQAQFAAAIVHDEDAWCGG